MFLLLNAPAEPVVLKSRIVEAAVFKSGLIFVTYEATVPAGGGDFRLEDVPIAIDGTFWYSSPQKIKLVDMSTSLKMVDKKQSVDAKSIPDLIAANVGKHVRLKIAGTANSLNLLTGTIVDVNVASGYLTLKKEDGFLRSIYIGTIVELDPTGLNTKGSTSSKEPQVQLKFHTQNSQSATIRYVSLEKGATWSGSYLVSLTKDGKSTIEGKAQLGMGGRKLQNTLTTVVAGQPNIPATWRYDLASGIGSITSYLQNTQDQFYGMQVKESDPFAMIPLMMQQHQQYGGYPGYGGGFSGGMGGGMGGVGGPGFRADADNAPMEQPYRLPDQTGSVKVESIYAYRLGNITLEPGERLTRRLFELESKYTDLFTASLPNDGAAVVNNVLRLKNEGKEPWTDGLTLVMKDGLPLAQVEMPFTPVGEVADLHLAEAKDVKVSRSTTSSGELVDAPSDMWPRMILKRQNQESTISLYNSRDDQIELELTTYYTGTVVAAEDGEVVTERSSSDLYNPGTRVTYKLKLQPGERKSLKVNWNVVMAVGTR